MKTFVLISLVVVATSCRQPPAPVTDTHRLAEEVDHKPELARKIISDVIAEPHGVGMIAEELAKNEIAADTVVDELMKHPAIAAVIADRCEAEKIARQVNSEPQKNSSPN